MKEVCLVRLIVIGLVIDSTFNTACCSHVEQHMNADEDDEVNRAKRGLVFLVPCEDNDIVSNSNDAREKTSPEIEKDVDQISSKNKRAPQESSDIFVRHGDILGTDPHSVENEEDGNTYIRMKSISDPKEVIKRLIEASKIGKNQGNADDEDEVAIIVGRKIDRPRKTRQRKYMCYCKETECRSRQCLRNQARRALPGKHKNFPNVKEYIEDDYDEDTSAEEVDPKPVVGAYNSNNEDDHNATPTPTITTEPTKFKFDIPFANNVNFDQRIILENGKPRGKKQKNNRPFPFYQNTAINMQPNQPFPFYHYNQYVMPHPGTVYNGVVPLQQRYDAGAPNYAISNDDMPSVIGRKFRNIDECIKLYGRPVCVMSRASTQSSINKVDTIDLSNDVTIKAYSGEKEPTKAGQYFATVAENPVKASESEAQTQSPPVYPTQYNYQTAIPNVNVQASNNYANPAINYGTNAAAQLPIVQSQPSYQNVPAYSAQVLSATTASPNIAKEPINYYAISGNVINSNLVNDKAQNSQASNTYYTTNNPYVPNYSSKENVKYDSYENKVEYPKTYDYSNSYQNMPQNQVPYSYPAIRNDYVPIYSSKENIQNNANNLIPSYTYSNVPYATHQSTIQPTIHTTPVHNSIDNTKTVNDQPVQVIQYYENNAQSVKPIYAYASGYQYALANSAPDYQKQPNYSNTNSGTSLAREHKQVILTSTHTTVPALSYTNSPIQPASIISSSQQNNPNKNNILYGQLGTPVLISPSGSGSSNSQPYISAQDPASPVSLQSYNSKPGIIIQPPELYNIENVVSVKDGNQPESVAQAVTTLEDVEDAEYKSHFFPQRVATLRAVDTPVKGRIKEESDLNSITDTTIKAYSENTSESMQIVPLKNDNFNGESYDKYNDTEKLFRGIEQIILKNDNVYDSIAESNIGSNENSYQQESAEATQKTFYGQAGGLSYENSRTLQSASLTDSNYPQKSASTESLVQSVDERPTIIYETASSATSPNSITDIGKTEIANTEANVALTYHSNNLNNPIQQGNNEALFQNAIKKVINNFVPGKAQDLIANYGSQNMSDFVGVNTEDLLPEILDTPILRNLFSLPEVEDMITDASGNFLTHIAGLPIISDVANYIRNAFRNIIGQIPPPHPTVAPMTVEEHQYHDGQWVTERVTLLQNSPSMATTARPPKEIFDKLESIINRSELGEEAASQPIIQNLIIKAVKHALDKEKGVIDELVIRQAFDLLIPPKPAVTRRAPPIENTNTLILEPQTTTVSDNYYKVAPIIAVTEHTLRGDLWLETPKNLVGKQPQQNVNANEEKKNLILKKIDELKLSTISSQERSPTPFNVEQTPRYNSNASNIERDSNQSKVTTVKILDYASSSEETENKSSSEETEIKSDEKIGSPEANIEDDSIERKPIKYYSPIDRILDYFKNHPSTDNPTLTTNADIIGQPNENVDLTASYVAERITAATVSHDRPKITNPSLAQTNRPQVIYIENSEKTNEQISTTKTYAEDPQTILGNPSNQSVNDSRLNLLVESTISPLQSESPTSKIVDTSVEEKTEAVRQALDQSNLGLPQIEYTTSAVPTEISAYVGKLIPTDYQSSQDKDLADLQDSNLMYVGDGVRLPLTIRKLQDGSYVLTLSDEVCKLYLHKKCPCCLPSGNNGVIVRERRNGEDVTELDLTDIGSTPNPNSWYVDSNMDSNLSRIRRESAEVRETTTTSGAPRIGIYRVNPFSEAWEEDRAKGLLSGNLYNRFGNTDDSVDRKDGTNRGQMRRTNRNGKRKRIRMKAQNVRKYHVDNNRVEARTFGSTFNYQHEDPVISQMKEAHNQKSYSRNSGPPYRYQRYAKEDAVVSGRTRTIKNVLHVMKELMINAPRKR